MKNKYSGRKFKKIENEEDTWFSKLGQGCIDTIFYSKNVKLKRFETVDVKEFSDHRALYAEFDI